MTRVSSRSPRKRASQRDVQSAVRLRAHEEVLDDDSVLVVDGGDFVATASIHPAAAVAALLARPRRVRHARWGAGFAMGAKIARPKSEVWIIYGDGSVGFTMPSSTRSCATACP